MSDNVRVAVRMRPFNKREKDRKSKCCIKMTGAQTLITDPESKKERKFTYDFSYNSFVPSDHEDFAGQMTVWNDIGKDVLTNAYDGYNCSLFAYGQTGSGKSYSMVGYGEDKGIIPIASERIFDRINDNKDENLSFRVRCSMLEIYMEKIRDLFNPQAGELRIRENPKTGFYVESLTQSQVPDYESIERLMEAGTKARTVAATQMNATSSRAHTIFQIELTQTTVDTAAAKATDKTSLINLIDLAGSERADSTGATGARLKEGAAINLSLTSLGNCISALAHNSGVTKKKKKKRVPYRDSALTMLLKNSLGGNAKTIMIAAVSPADINHDETLSTLRYADRAKQIKNKAVVNEDPNERMIKKLKQEIEELRRRLGEGGGAAGGGGGGGGANLDELKEQMEAEKAAELERMRKEMEERIRSEMLGDAQAGIAQSATLAKANEERLAAMGVATGEQRKEALEKAKTEPHIVNLHEDPTMDGQIMYFLEAGKDTLVGLPSEGGEEGEGKKDIPLRGLSIKDHHATITNDGNGSIMLVCSADAKTHVNGDPQTAEPVRLHNRYRIIFGNNHVFKVVIPGEEDTPEEGEDVPEVIDYAFAMQEINRAQARAMAEQEAKLREEAEKAKREAEERIKALEAKYEQERLEAQRKEEERQKAWADQQQATGGKELEALKAEQERLKSEAEAKEAELRRKLEEQIQETERVAARKQREMKQRSLLDEKLLKTIPLVNEGNAIADEIGKNVVMDVKLMANQNSSRRRSSLNAPLAAQAAAKAAIAKAKAEAEAEAEDEDASGDEDDDGEDEAAAGAGGGSGDEEDDDKDDDKDDDEDEHRREEFVLDTEVYIRVAPKEGKGPKTLWDYGEFMDRLYAMREMYQQFVANGRSFAGTIYEGNSANNPFYVESKPMLIGRSTIYLDTLVHCLSIKENTPIIDYKGKEEGELVVRIVPHLGEKPPEDPDEEDEALEDEEVEDLSQLRNRKLKVSVIIQGARGLGPDKCVDTYVQYRFFLEDDWTITPTAKGKTTIPTFNHTTTFEPIVTEQFEAYISGDAIEFEVWGKADDGQSTAPPAAAPAKAAAGAGASASAGASPAAAGGGDTSALEKRIKELEAQLAARKEGGEGDADVKAAQERAEAAEKRAKAAEEAAAAKEEELAAAKRRADDAAAATRMLLVRAGVPDDKVASQNESRACIVM